MPSKSASATTAGVPRPDCAGGCSRRSSRATALTPVCLIGALARLSRCACREDDMGAIGTGQRELIFTRATRDLSLPRFGDKDHMQNGEPEFSREKPYPRSARGNLIGAP